MRGSEIAGVLGHSCFMGALSDPPLRVVELTERASSTYSGAHPLESMRPETSQGLES